MALFEPHAMSCLSPLSRVKRSWTSGSSGEFLTPDVWSGRALQEVSSSWRSAVLHQCIRSLIGAVLLRTNMDISARAISLTDSPQRGHVGHQCSHAPGTRILHLFPYSPSPPPPQHIVPPPHP